MSQIPTEELALKVEGVSKGYDLNMKHTTNFKQLLRQVASNFMQSGQNGENILWALNDISFDLKKGDILGIIGDNGSGKSTLLKLISDISKPSTGQIIVDGNITSILDVGTGFHPELTGHENIYLSGSIMGMSNSEIDEKYEQIVEFSGIREFINVPVKRYSSGMFIRLAFSVAAHLHSDIILLDEVISVGDASFRMKSFQKIRELAQSGKTVLIISHELSSIMELCNKGMILENGRIKSFGTAKQIVGDYMEDTIKGQLEENQSGENRAIRVLREQMQMTNRKIREKEKVIRELQQTGNGVQEDEGQLSAANRELEELFKVREETRQQLEEEMQKQSSRVDLQNSRSWSLENAHGNEDVKLLSIECRPKNKSVTTNITPWDEVVLDFSYQKMTDEPTLPTFIISYQMSVMAFIGNPLFSKTPAFSDFDRETGTYHRRCIIPARFLNNGVFSVSITFVDKHAEKLVHLPNLIHFRVEYDQKMLDEHVYNGRFPGPLFPDFQWNNAANGS